MELWKVYASRLGVKGNYGCGEEDSGNSKRSRRLAMAQARIARKLPGSLSYEKATTDNGAINISVGDVTGDFTTKKIFSMPGETLPHGSVIEWGGTKWLVTEVDAHSVIYSKGLMRRCNYLLKWLDDAGNIIERWCVVEDGTKYLIGEKDSKIMAVGDSRIAVTIGKDKDTDKLSRGRRFLIDDPEYNDDVLAFEITKPNKLFNVYDGKGVFRFIMGETNLTDNDNVELRIADYYSWKPDSDYPDSDVKTEAPLDEIVSNAKDQNDKRQENVENSGVWL